jgi:uncharacterized protein (TIGR02145 family)
MKRITLQNGFIAVFLITSFLFDSCKPDEPLLKAVVSVSPARSLTVNTATLVALVTPNQDNTIVTFEYKLATETTWTTKVLADKYSGSILKEVTLEVTGLQLGTQYNFRVKALNQAGEAISSIGSFATNGLTKAEVFTSTAKNVKITSATIEVTATPHQPNTVISLEYNLIGDASWQTKTLATIFSGDNVVSVSFDLTDLQANSDYDFRIKMVNQAGEVIGTASSFMTYAASDYDGNLYHSVTIGAQTWLKENFRGTHYANGDPIPNVTDASIWSTLTTGAYCWYNNDSKNGEVYGGLYNWYVGADPRGLIVGYHTPTIYEWADLSNYLGGYSISGPKVMESGHAHWNTTSSEATNSSGFTALPGGTFGPSYTSDKFTFSSLGEVTAFWASTSAGNSGNAPVIESANTALSVGNLFDQKDGFSLRLLKN